MRIAVIGAGVGGLVALYTITKRLTTDKFNGLEIVAFEQVDQIGGQWVFPKSETEIYEEGLPMMTSMYKGLVTNVPYPLMTFHPDHPFPADTPTFATWDQFLAHVEQFVIKFDLLRYIRLSTMVTKIARDEKGSVLLEVKDVKNQTKTNEVFDYVFVCCGQERIPFVPPDVDTSKFSGTVLHYHDLRDPTRLYGKRVLVIGSSYGASDMVYMLTPHVQGKLLVSYHSHKPFWYSADRSTCDLRPMLTNAIGKTVYFADGSSADVDAIVFATGFQQYHPLVDDLALDFHMAPSIFPLYKNVVHPDFPKLFFIGKTAELTLLLMRYQAELGCSIIDDRFVVPSADSMKAEIAEFHSRWRPQLDVMFESDITDYYPTIELERELASSIASICGLEPLPDYLHKLFYKTIRQLKMDNVNFKKYRLADPTNFSGANINDDQLFCLHE